MPRSHNREHLNGNRTLKVLTGILLTVPNRWSRCALRFWRVRDQRPRYFRQYAPTYFLQRQKFNNRSRFNNLFKRNNIANNFKKWQRIVITNKCYSLSLCSKFLTTYFFNGLMANCGSQRERERERDCVKLSSRRGIGLKSIVAYPFVRKVLLLRLEIFSPLSSSKLLECLFRTETGKIKFTSISCFNSFFENNNNRE